MRYLLSLLFWANSVIQVNPTISFPRPGDALQGLVSIAGTNQILGFVSYELSFTFSGDTTGTWFYISKSEQMVQDGKLGDWDTSLITDGNYDLRMRIHLIDGSNFDIKIENLRIRNYSPIEAPIISPTVVKSVATTESLIPEVLNGTSIPSATNPLVLSKGQLFLSLGTGVLVIITCFLVVLFLIKLRRN